MYHSNIPRLYQNQQFYPFTHTHVIPILRWTQWPHFDHQSTFALNEKVKLTATRVDIWVSRGAQVSLNTSECLLQLLFLIKLTLIKIKFLHKMRTDSMKFERKVKMENSTSRSDRTNYAFLFISLLYSNHFLNWSTKSSPSSCYYMLLKMHSFGLILFCSDLYKFSS